MDRRKRCREILSQQGAPRHGLCRDRGCFRGDYLKTTARIARFSAQSKLQEVLLHPNRAQILDAGETRQRPGSVLKTHYKRCLDHKQETAEVESRVVVVP